MLILGKSGIGKSECALDLVSRGHRLVSDDVVDIKLYQPNILTGSGPDLIRYHMEIRGLGIINIKDLFGISSIRQTKKIGLVIILEQWEDDQVYERLGLEKE